MSSERHIRVMSLLHEMVATFIAREANSDPLITVTRIVASPDYRNATVFFTTIPDGREEDAYIFLKRYGGELKHFIMKNSDLKIIPHLDFAVDIGEKHRQHIDNISNKINKNNE